MTLKEVSSTVSYQAVIQNSIPYSHWQNAGERDMQTVVNGASNLLHALQWLRADSWDLALLHYIDVRNRTPNSKSLENPYQIITGHPLDLSIDYKFSFGDLLAVALSGTGREWKLDFKNQMGIYVGQLSEKRSSLVYWLYFHTTSTRLNCWKIEVTDNKFLHHYSARARMRDGSLPFKVIKDAFFDFDAAVELDPHALAEWKLSLTNTMSQPLVDVDESDLSDVVDTSVKRIPLPPSIHGMTLRSKRSLNYANCAIVQSYVADSYAEFVDVYGNFMYRANSAYSAKVTVGAALKSADRLNWIDAICDEVSQLLAGTLKVVDDKDFSGPHRVVQSTMQLKQKQHQDLTTDIWKARLCACGNELFGLVAETFSPTISALAYTIVHQISIIDRLQKITVDTVGAFLTQVYPIDALPLYIIFFLNVANALGLPPQQKYRNLKYTYGLPDASIAFYRAYAVHLVAKGYQRTFFQIPASL